jgi:hypothetical protein
MTSFAEAVRGAMALDPEIFRIVQDTSPVHHLGLWIAFLAGLSQGIGQAFILFVNRVRPLRFALSLVVEALLFAIGFLVWACSTWLVAHLWFRIDVSPTILVRTLGLAHAPQLLGFFGALPYLGAPWLNLLSLWTAIAFVVGLVAVSGLSTWQAFGCLIGGWLLTQALQRSAGQPVMNLGRWLVDRAAGVNVVTDRSRLDELLQSGRRR